MFKQPQKEERLQPVWVITAELLTSSPILAERTVEGVSWFLTYKTNAVTPLTTEVPQELKNDPIVLAFI
jgi:hypothetical protein